MFGSHLSVAGGLVNALHEARNLHLDTVQIFTRNQRQWRPAPLKDDDADAWLAELHALHWQGRAVAHNSYLVNLASPSDEARARSIDAQRDELQRCRRLGITRLVFHPGSHLGAGEPEGLRRCALACAQLLRDTHDADVALCIENTVGSGANLGGPFQHLADIRALALDALGRDAPHFEQRIGFCFDTCHAHAAGHDMSSEPAARDAIASFEHTCGVGMPVVVHCNDSKGALGSHLDRHEHIGAGAIGLDGFRAVVNHPRWRDVPKILETPKGQTPAGTPWDTLNLRRLRRLVSGEPPRSDDAKPPAKPRAAAPSAVRKPLRRR